MVMGPGGLDKIYYRQVEETSHAFALELENPTACRLDKFFALGQRNIYWISYAHEQGYLDWTNFTDMLMSKINQTWKTIAMFMSKVN